MSSASPAIAYAQCYRLCPFQGFLMTVLARGGNYGNSFGLQEFSHSNLACVGGSTLAVALVCGWNCAAGACVLLGWESLHRSNMFHYID